MILYVTFQYIHLHQLGTRVEVYLRKPPLFYASAFSKRGINSRDLLVAMEDTEREKANGSPRRDCLLMKAE